MIWPTLAARLLGRLSVRFTLLIGGLLIVFAIVFALFNTYEARRALWRETSEQVAFLGQFGSELVDEDLKNVRLDSLQTLMRHFAARPDILYARVLDKYRRTVADGVGNTIPFSAVSRDDLFDAAVRKREKIIEMGVDAIHVAQPIVLDGDMIGVLRFGVSLRMVEASTGDLVRRNAAIVILFLMIALPLTAILTHRATMRVRALTETSQRIASGELDTPIDTSGHGEVAELGRSMARMVRSLSDNAAEIQALTFIDPLTGQPNRAQLQLRLEAAIAALDEKTDRVALFLLDVVRFKRVNDALGMEGGDLLLRDVCQRLVAALENWREAEAKTDGASFETVVARLSADEFGLMIAGPLKDSDLDAALWRIHRAFDEPFALGEHVLDLSLCIGVALAPSDGRSFSALLHNGGVALQAAKKAGRASHRFFAPELDERAYRRLAIESDLRQAIRRGEIEVFFQPQVSCADGRAIGAEALVRWRHPERGLISPAEFVPIAEETGLIIDIGGYVISEVCHRLAAWTARGLTPRLSINVSAMQFHRPDFAKVVLSALQESGANPRLIEIEVTESVAMTDPDKVAEMMLPLRQAGLRFAIDDFGTGYSSLSVLTRLPFDVLKIDRAFVSGIDTGDPERRVLITTMLAMARGLGLDVIAEGVERVEEAVFLNEQGCPFAQGFLYARPMPADDFEPWFIAHRRRDARLLQDRLREALAGLPRYAEG